MAKAQSLKLAQKVGVSSIVVVVIFVLTFAQINASIAPFALAFLFASIYIQGNNKIISGIVAFGFSLVVGYSQGDIISMSFAVAMYFGLVWIVVKVFPKMRLKHYGWWQKSKIEYIIAIFFYIIGNSARVIFVYADLEKLYMFLVGVCIGIVFLIACFILINAIHTRMNRIPWTVDQKICAGVFAVAISLGLVGLETDYFYIHKFVSVFLILVMPNSLIVGASMGLGASLSSLDLTYVAVYAVLALAGQAFKANKYLSAVAVMSADLVLGFYFGAYFGYGLTDILPLVIACVLALVLPKTLKKYFDTHRNVLGGYLVSKNTINKNRTAIYKRLDNLGSVFNEMQNTYRALVTGATPPDASAKMIARAICDNVCDSCEHRPNCRKDTKSSQNIDTSFEKLSLVGLQRGVVNFLDLPPDMSIRCTKLSNVINVTNNVVASVQNQESTRRNLDASKILMAHLLSGMSKLCKTVATELGSGVVFDIDKGQKIKDGLLSVGIVASDCLITSTGTGEYNVSVLVPRIEANNPAIERVISKVVGHNMSADAIDDAETSGFAIVTVKTAPRYKIIYGVASVPKNFGQANGDSYSFLKITSDKSMMALCDGMGTGERANRASTLAISLIENFYKASFPSEIIMESVNQLLIVTGNEAFTAIDCAVFSLGDGQVTFIKVGGVEGFIKRAREIEVIEAGSLPMGIVEEMVPKITRAHVSIGDIVVLCSDGVTDSFGDRVKLASFINNLDGTNPQKLADEVVQECLRRTVGVAIDDCTVISAQIVDNK